MNFEKQLKKLQKLQIKLSEVRTKEAALRRELCNHAIKDSGKEMENGRVTVKGSFDDIKFTVAHSLGYSLDKAVLKSIWSELPESEQSVIKNEPKLDLRAYKQLDDEAMIQAAVMTKLAMPTLKIEKV